jgi:trk system potassium uptake protein TrkA
MKVRTIIVKAPNEEHKLILEKIGATEVMIPEKEIAHKVAKSLLSPNVLDYLPLSDDYMISEMAPPNSFLGKSLAQLQLRSRFHIEVIAIRDVISDKTNMIPGADFVIKDGDVLVMVGKEKDIQKIQ